MAIYEEFLSRVENGERFSINLEKRNLKVGKTYLIKEGKWDETKELCSISLQNPIPYIEELYADYKYSCPSERSESRRKNYFKALPVEELTDAQMINGMNREYAKARLEGFVLCVILQGTMPWNANNWFWQSKNDADLIILKKWIEGRKQNEDGKFMAACAEAC